MTNDGERQDRPILVAAVVLLLSAHLGFSLWPALFRVDQDFGNAYVAARIVRDGQPLDRAYERDFFLAEASRFPELGFVAFIPHPPANAVLLLPLARQGPRLAKVVWTLFLAAALVASFVVTRKLVSLSGWQVALVFLLPTAALANALAYGQPYPLLLLCFCFSLLALVRGWPVAAGLVLAPTVVIKLYGLPFLAYFLWTRRWKAAAGFVLGTLVLTCGSVALLGLEVHRVFLEEILPWALRGEIQDPYSPIWGSITSLTYRLFRFERDLNPLPVGDLPGVAAVLSRGLPLAILATAIGASQAAADVTRVRREWAMLMLASLAASPLGATYHFVLLVLPVALLWADERVPWGARAWLMLTLLFLAASSAPHYGARWAHGWANLLAYGRLYGLLALLALAVAPTTSKRRLVAAASLGVFAGLTFFPVVKEEPWTPLEVAGGYLAAAPIDCGDEQGWLAITGRRLIVETSQGRRLSNSELPTAIPRCEDGRVATGAPNPPSDGDSLDGVRIVADRRAGKLWLVPEGESPRVLANGRFRHPRLSPDRGWVVAESWEAGSWDLRAFDVTTLASRLVAGGPSNELEPSWTASGDGILFASDRRRGLGSTAVYRVAFRR